VDREGGVRPAGAENGVNGKRDVRGEERGMDQATKRLVHRHKLKTKKLSDTAEGSATVVKTQGVPIHKRKSRRRTKNSGPVVGGSFPTHERVGKK